jgi:hypothetical protein
MRRAGQRHLFGIDTVLAQRCHDRFAADQETRPAAHDDQHRQTRPAPMVDRRSSMPGRRLPGVASAKPGAGGRRSLRVLFLMAPRLLAREVRQPVDIDHCLHGAVARHAGRRCNLPARDRDPAK